MNDGTNGTIRLGDIAVRFLLEGRSCGGSLAMFEFDVAASGKVPVAHSHDNYDETIYGLKGTLTWTVDGKRSEVGPGRVLFIPRGAVHRFDNLHESDASSLAVVTPGILGPAYFSDIAAVVRAAAGGPPDLAAIGAVMKRHGLTPRP